MKQQESFAPERFGLREAPCPACDAIALQPGGLFRWCAHCGLEIGDQEHELLSDQLIRLSLVENRGGGLA